MTRVRIECWCSAVCMCLHLGELTALHCLVSFSFRYSNCIYIHVLLMVLRTIVSIASTMDQA